MPILQAIILGITQGITEGGPMRGRKATMIMLSVRNEVPERMSDPSIR